jgi:UDP-glucose 4-epimerase
LKYVVTGGAGFIGSNIVKKLVARGDHVTVIDNLNTGKEENLASVKDKIIFLKDSILNLDLLEKQTQDIDGIFHQAALASVQDSFSKPDEYHNVNVNGTENILKLAKKNNFKVVYASSSSVYGNPEKIPIKESDSKNPINPYAETKLDKEKLAKKYSEMGVKVIGLRYFNVYGLRQNDNYAGVISKFLKNLSKEKPPIIYGSGLQIRDFVYVGDICKANYLTMTSKVKKGFVNIGSGKIKSIKQLANLMIKIHGMDSQPIFTNIQKGDIKLSQSDSTKAKKILSWKSKTTLSSWLKNKI